MKDRNHSGPSCVIENPPAPFPALKHPQELINWSENTWKVPKTHKSSLWIKSSLIFLQMAQSPEHTIVCEIPTVTLGQELWNRPLNHLKAKADDKATPSEGLCQRGYLIYSLNCLKKTCTWHLHRSRLIQTTLEDWITMNYSHKHCAIQTEFTSLTPKPHKFTMLLSCDTPQIHHLFSSHRLHYLL